MNRFDEEEIAKEMLLTYPKMLSTPDAMDALRECKRRAADGTWAKIPQHAREILMARMYVFPLEKLRERYAEKVEDINIEGGPSLTFAEPVTWEEAIEALAAVDPHTAMMIDEVYGPVTPSPDIN